jgi:hypothetical protein
MAAHQLTDVTVVADAGMISQANQVALRAAGLSFILGARIPLAPDVLREWRDKHPNRLSRTGWCWPAVGSTSTEKARGIPDRVIHTRYSHDQTHRTLRGIDELLAKAERAVDDKAPVKRNDTSNSPASPRVRHSMRTSAAAHRASFRMSKHNLQKSARPIASKTAWHR